MQLSGTVVQQTLFDLTIEQCVAANVDLACAILIRQKTLLDVEVKVRQLP